MGRDRSQSVLVWLLTETTPLVRAESRCLGPQVAAHLLLLHAITSHAGARTGAGAGVLRCFKLDLISSYWESGMALFPLYKGHWFFCCSPWWSWSSSCGKLLSEKKMNKILENILNLTVSETSGLDVIWKEKSTSVSMINRLDKRSVWINNRRNVRGKKQ